MKDASNHTASGQNGEGEATQWLTAREAASRLGMAPCQLYELIDQGALAAYHVEEDLKLRSGDVAVFPDAQPSA